MTVRAKSSALPIILAAGFAIVLAALLAFFLIPPATPPGTDQTEVAAAPTEEVAPAPAPVVATETPAAPEPAPAPILPEFDTFRVEPDGAMVVAGRAAPETQVDIMLGDAAIERVVTDAQGSFVAFPVASPSDQPRRLSLIADPDGAALQSQTSFIVAPIADPLVVAEAEGAQEEDTIAEAEVTENAVDEAEVAAVEPTDETDQETPPQLSAVQPQIADSAPVPPTVLQTTEDGVRVVQGASGLQSPDFEPNVALDAITYDPDGEVRLSGRAVGEGAIQVYINNEPVTTSAVSAGGWQLALPDIDTGVYTLRIDEVDTEGAVVSRLETPFKREEPAEVAAVMAEDTSAEGFEVAVRTVQPGSTLWAIAEENLGEGILYVEVFEANRDLIRDPDLIYPGQIFRIPEVSQ